MMDRAARPPITDFHTHAFPDDIAARTMARLAASARGERPYTDGTVSALLASMDRAGIARSVVYQIATTPAQYESILRFCNRIRSDRIAPFPSVHPDAADPAGELRRIAREGFRGIKLHGMYQSFQIDEDRMTPIYEAAAREGLVVCFHAGDDFSFDDASACAPARIANVAERFGDLAVVAAHMGGYLRWRDVRDLLAGRPNVYLETSFTLGRIRPELFGQLLARHGVERVLFGSDSPWSDQAQDVEQIECAGLPAGTLRSILDENATRLLEKGVGSLF